MDLMQYLTRLYNATSQAELSAIAAEMSNALGQGTLTRDDYNTLYNAYLYYTNTRAGKMGAQGAPAPTTETDWQGKWKEFLPGAAWGQRYNLPAYGGNPYQRWQASQLGPSLASYGAGVASPEFASAPGGFEEYMSTYGQAGARGQALPQIQRAAALPATDYETWKANLEDIAGENAYRNLMASALQRRFAAPVANVMASRVPALETAWEAETQGGQTGQNFLQYLMQKYGLR